MIAITGASKTDKLWVEKIKDRILSLEYEQIDSGHDKFKLTVDNSDRSLLAADEVGISVKKIFVQWGRIGKLSRVRKINLVKVKGFKKLIYEGTGNFWKYDLTRNNKLWRGMSHYDIARDLGKKMGFGTVDATDPGVKKPMIKQFETDMQFLIRLGKEVGYSCWSDEEGLHWKERDASQQTSLRVVYGGKFEDDEGYGRLIGEPEIEFGYNRSTPKKSTAISPIEVEKLKKAQGGIVRNIDGKMVLLKEALVTKKKEAGDNTSAARKESYAEQCQINPAESSETTYSPAGKSYLIIGKQRSMSKKKVKVSLLLYGVPDLVKGKTLELYGFADLVDGKYYIKKMTDFVEGEYHTQKVELRRGSAPNKAKDANRVKGKTNTRCSNSSKGKSAVQRRNEEILVRNSANVVTKALRRLF